MYKLLDYTLKSGPFELSFSRLIISHFPFECFDSRGLGISKSMMTALLWWAWSRCTNISIKTVYKLVLKKGRVEEGGVLYMRGSSAASETRDSQLPDDALKKSWSILGALFLFSRFYPGRELKYVQLFAPFPSFAVLCSCCVSSPTVTAAADS